MQILNVGAALLKQAERPNTLPRRTKHDMFDVGVMLQRYHYIAESNRSSAFLIFLVDDWLNEAVGGRFLVGVVLDLARSWYIIFLCRLSIREHFLRAEEEPMACFHKHVASTAPEPRAGAVRPRSHMGLHK
jgi:hypothetical protein